MKLARTLALSVALALSACERKVPTELAAIADPPPPTPRPQPTPTPTASFSAAPLPSPAPTFVEPPKELVLARSIALTASTHGIEGRLDVFAARLAVDYVTPLDTILKLVPTTGAPTNLTFKNAQSPSARAERFGDAARSSLALEYEVVWVTGSARHLVVVELESGKLVWRHATHRKSGERRAVDVTMASMSGAANGVGRVHTSAAGGAELLQVVCDRTTPQNSCTSMNRVFSVRDGKWWWDERVGTGCRPKTNGWCSAWSAPFPERSEFPSSSE